MPLYKETKPKLHRIIKLELKDTFLNTDIYNPGAVEHIDYISVEE